MKRLAAAALAAVAFSSDAAPFVPASDSVVLERLAVRRDDPFSREAAMLRAQLRQEPRNVAAAVRLVEAFVFRRAICAIPTNSMNKTFATFGKALKKDRYLES